MKNEKEKVHRREGGNVRERGQENAWRSEKGERRMTKYIHMREKGIEMGQKWGGGLRRENTSALDRRVECNMYGHIQFITYGKRKIQVCF